MATVKTDDKHYKNIANSIRQVTGGTDTYKPEEFPLGVAQVYEKGLQAGHTEGYGEGYAEGLAEGDAMAMRSFWDEYQQNGQRQDYNFAFSGAGWNNALLRPLHDIRATSGYQMFAYCPFEGSLKKRLAEYGVDLIFSGNGSFMNLFGYADKITELGVIDLSGLTSAYNTHIFNQCKALKSIEKLILPAGQTTWSAWFTGCTALETVIFEGTIEYGGLDLSDSPNLTVSSLSSILNALADKSGSATAPKLILGAVNLSKLTSSHREKAAQKGWNLT